MGIVPKPQHQPSAPSFRDTKEEREGRDCGSRLANGVGGAQASPERFLLNFTMGEMDCVLWCERTPEGEEGREGSGRGERLEGDTGEKGGIPRRVTPPPASSSSAHDVLSPSGWSLHKSREAP